MGPVSDPPARLAPLVIGTNRRATVSRGRIDLELELSGVPDARWIEGFAHQEAAAALEGVVVPDRPTVEGTTIRWSIPASGLMLAWQHICRCVDRANSTSSRLPSRATRAVLPTAADRSLDGSR